MDSKKPLYKSINLWIMVLFLLYSALGFFTVPYLIKKELVKIANNDLNSQLSIDKITFNPFTISSSLTAVKLTDNDSTLWFSSDQIHLDIHLWKTLFKHLSIASISIDSPYVNLIADKENNLKYPQLNPSQTDDDFNMLLDIDLIEITKGNINYLNSSENKEINLNLQQIVFQHQKFTTQNLATDFELSFVTNNNEEVHLTGQFNFAQLKLELNWKINNWLSATVFNIISDENNQILGLKNQSGTIDADGTLLINNLQETSPEIHVNHLKISILSTESTSNNQPELNIAELAVNDITIDLNQQQIVIDTISSTDAEFSINIDQDYALIWPELDQSTKQQDNSNEKENSNWSYQLKQINLSNTLVKLNKYSKGESHLNNIYLSDISISNISSEKLQTSDINLSLNADKQGHIDVSGQLVLDPFELNSNIQIADINIAEFKTWLPENINLTVDQGLLSLQQKVSLKGSQYTSNGSLQLKNLKILDNNKQEFLLLKRLEVIDSHIDSKTKTISLSQIILDQAQGSLTISSDQQLNINQLVTPDSDNQDVKTDADDWIIEINQIELIDSKTHLTDQSIDPHYHTELSKLNGSIKGLSSSNLSKADVDLSGVLDTYGKINIAGQINPLSDDAYTDLSIQIENLSLENFSPYSAKFLGFPITRGKADFELKYKLNQSLLKGLNDLKFKQLKFGDKNQSKDAVSLPLKLAVSLLTDGKGIMKINLPVSGNIDDPEFSYGGIVFKAMFKLITGIVASPFKLLGKLIPGGAELDLSGIQFKAGTVELEQDEEKKLQAMQKIIEQRPAIILELTGVINTVNDKKLLQQQMLLNNLAVATINFDDTTFQNKIKQSYLSTFNQQKWDKLVANASTEQITDVTLLNTNAYNDLLESLDVAAQLDLLAKQRAQFIQQQMIEKYDLPQDKVFIKSSEQSEVLYPQVKFGVGQ